MFADLIHRPAEIIPWGAVVLASLVATGLDVRTGRIPNWLTLPLLLAGLVYAGVAGGGLVDGVSGCLLVGTPFVLLFLFAGGGGGDAKLMGAIGAWIGVAHAVPVLLAVLLSGAVLGLGYALLRRQFTSVLVNLSMDGMGLLRVATGRQTPGEASKSMADPQTFLKMPYGIAICTGVCLVAMRVLLWER